MISFSSQGGTAVENNSNISYNSFSPEDLLEKIRAKHQGFYSDEVLENTQTLEEIQKFRNVHLHKKYVVVLGIGGSALGGIALQKMLAPETDNSVFFLDNLDPEILGKVLRAIQLEDTMFLVMSKSGGTTETLSQYLFFAQKLREKSLIFSDHFCFVTGKTGFLRKEGEKENIKTFDIPENVGGRFSVLTPIGLLPASFMNINIIELLKGARAMRENFLESLPEENLAFQFASIQYNALQNGITKNVLYAYSNRLFFLGDWFRQLLAESTGKKFSQTGEEIYTGITPINALGVTDHHSQNQLYMHGPKDSLVCFLETEKFSEDFMLPDLGYTEEPLSFLQEKSFSTILNAEKKAAQQSLTEEKRPWVSITLPEISPRYLGQMFLFFESSVAFLGEMMNINAFDQPGVERTKILTKEGLKACSKK